MWRKFSCTGNWGLVNDYADERLTGRRRAAAERHLAGCARCRELLRDLEVVRRAVADAAVESPSERFWERSMQAVAATAAQRRSPRAHWRWAAGVALAVAAVLLLWFVPIRRIPGPESGPAPQMEAEVAESEFLAQHAASAFAVSLGTGSHYVLLNAISDEGRSLERAPRALPAGWSEDVQTEPGW